MQRFILLFTAVVLMNTGQAQNFNTDSLLGELKNSKKDTNRVNLLKNIGVSLANQDPQRAIEYWKQGVELSKMLQYDLGLARTYINISSGFAYSGKYDSAIVYADTAINYCKKIKDANRLALVYLNKGDAYRNLEDFKKALVYCDTARNYAEQTGNTDRLARIYTIIGDMYATQRQFNLAVNNYNKALGLYRKDENTLMEGQLYSDFADVYKQTGKGDLAIFFYKKAIFMADSIKDMKNLSTYYADLADIYITREQYAEAETNVSKSLDYARQQENNIQLATTYCRLCNLNIKQKKFGEAIRAGNLAYQLAAKETHIGWQHEAATLLAEAYIGSQDYQNGYKFLVVSRDLNDSIISQRYNGEIAGLQNSFELKEKDKEILLLNKDKELQQQRLFRQRILISGSALLIIFFLIGIALLINRNRLRNKMKELELRNQIAADLHDEVGSSLSSIHMLGQMATQQGNEAKQKDILARMSTNARETMDKMGDIVWMIKPGETEAISLKQRMERFAYEICSSKNINFSLQLEELEKAKLSMGQRKNIYLIFKEVLNNAVKYSGTESISVSCSIQNKQLVMQVRDIGKGFDNNIVKKGNGLDNMKSRAQEMDGTLEIESAEGKGTVIKLTVPVYR
jgi:signal transduction histidine kinase